MEESANPLEQMTEVKFLYSPELIEAINNDLPGYINGSLSDLVECKKQKDIAIKSAENAKIVVDKAISKAKEAKDIATGLFKNGKAIEALKVVSESEATALGELSDAQIKQAEALRVFFNNQTKQATISRNLCLLGMGNQAVANTVLKRLKEGIDGGEMSNISEDVYQEFERIVMWWSQVEDMNAKIRSYEQRVAEIQSDYEKIFEKLANTQQDLEKENEARLHSVDNLQKDIIEVKTDFSNSISETKRELKEEYFQVVNEIRQHLEEIKTEGEIKIRETNDQIDSTRKDFLSYQSLFIHKKLFKTIVLFLSVTAFIFSIIALVA